MKGKRKILSAILTLTIAGSIGLSTVTQSACVNTCNNNNRYEQAETLYHKLTLNLNGGELPEGQNVTKFEADKKLILPTPKRNGYTFVGWFDNVEFTGNAYVQIDKSKATSDKEFWAKWEVYNEKSDTYTVMLYFNNGTLKDGQSDVKNYKYGTAIILPELKRDGYCFGGWFEDKNFKGSPVTEIPATATGNKVYYAKWIKIGEEDPDVKPLKYIVTFNYNYDEASTSIEIEVDSGKTVAKPNDPSREGYEFLGWFEDASGSSEYNFTSGVIKSFTLYALWKVKTFKVTLNFNGGTIVSGINISTYTYGEGATLPVLEKSGYIFEGWYESSIFDGNMKTEISKTDTGDKTYYAKWTMIEATTINISSFGGYEEGAYIELAHLKDTVLSDYTVSYKPSLSGVADYTLIDSELIREIEYGSIRADIVGLSAGNYDIKVTVKGFTAEKTNIQVSTYDRSGYAHFNYYKGVGGYNDDGMVKSGATIVYVTEETKNTVQATIGGTRRTGIVDILTHASSMDGQPLVVRIIGTIGAATWKEINYDIDGNCSDGIDYDVNNPLPKNKVVGMNGKQLPEAYTSQAELIAGGYNELDESVFSELKGLNSVAKYSQRNGIYEYDSAWNNCTVSGASNVTVEGIGENARIFQWGFTWATCNSIEVRNLIFEDYTEHACSFEGNQKASTLDDFNSTNIWVHHNTFLEGKNYWDISPQQNKHEGDSATAFKGNAYVTISYNHYFKNNKTGLIGGDSDSSMSANFTFHHNRYENCNSILPLARQANMHIYNNLYDGTTGINMLLCANAYAFIENCYFRNVNNPVTTDNGYAKVYNCGFEGKAIDSSVKNVVQVSSRTELVLSTNLFGQNFDTNPILFYYDSNNKKSNVSNMLGLEDVLVDVPKLSGVHKNI